MEWAVMPAEDQPDTQIRGTVTMEIESTLDVTLMIDSTNAYSNSDKGSAANLFKETDIVDKISCMPFTIEGTSGDLGEATIDFAINDCKEQYGIQLSKSAYRQERYEPRINQR